MRVDISSWELHNLERRGGRLRTRRGLVSTKTPTAGTVYVAGFSIEAPFTTEVWHYLVEQSTTTLAATLRVYTEELLELFSYDLGVLPADPVITHATAANQLVINSPSFSGPIFGMVGGGLFAMEKTVSVVPDQTALDPPAGLVAAIGDRFVIASGNSLLVSSQREDGDPRTFVAQNVIPLGGTIYDLAQGPDGALWAFTSVGVTIIPRDAFGSDIVQRVASNLTAVSASRSRSAAASNDRVAVLQRDGLVLMGQGGQERIDLFGSRTRHYLSRSVEQPDLRATGEVHATAEGFAIGFGAARAYFLDVNIREGFRSYVFSFDVDLNLVGTLRSREGETLYVLRDRVAQPTGNRDFGGSADHTGLACGRVDLPEGRSAVLRRVTTAADNPGLTHYVVAGDTVSTVVAATRATDAVIGTSLWSTTEKYRARDTRTVRHSMRERLADPQLEIGFDGGDLPVDSFIDLELVGQGKTRRGTR